MQVNSILNFKKIPDSEQTGYVAFSIILSLGYSDFRNYIKLGNSIKKAVRDESFIPDSNMSSDI